MARGRQEALQVVFVCTGNRARSPLAEALFRRRVDPRAVEVSSFGTLDASPHPALTEAIAVAESLGVDLRSHRSRTLERGCLAEATLVVGFESSHVAAAIERGGADAAQVFMLLEIRDLLEQPLPLVEAASSPSEQTRSAIQLMDARRTSAAWPMPPPLRDPYGEPQRVFAETARVIDATASLLAATIFRTFEQIEHPPTAPAPGDESFNPPLRTGGSLAGRLLGRVRQGSGHTDR